MFGIFGEMCHRSIVKSSLQHFPNCFSFLTLLGFFPQTYFVFVYLFAYFLGEPDLHKNSEDLVSAEEKHAETHS